MLTESQQDDAREALEEFVSALISDPVRVGTRDLHQLQTILASYGLTIEAITKPVSAPIPALPSPPPILPTGSARILTPEQAHSATNVYAKAPAPVTNAATPLAARITPVERGILNTTQKAAEDLAHMPGFTFRASVVLQIVKIAKRLAGER